VLSELNEFLGQSQASLTDALPAFGSGDGYFGLVDSSEIGIDSSYATDAIVLGLFDSLPGVTIVF
jgi:hypothetical protein